MPFPRGLLIENEELIVELRPHWIALVGPAAVTVLLVAGWVGALAFAPDDGFLRSITIWGSSALALFVFVLYPVRRFVAWVTSYFVVTSDRIIHREGWIAKRSMEIPLEAINDVRFNQGVFERMIGAGDLVISSASEFGRQVFGDIRNPEGVQKTIYHQGELNKERMYRGGPTGQTGPPPAAPSTMTELERLAKLRDDGVLTQAEFEEQKKKILGGS
ncbi:MAG TPA: PH domain-containing protein [Actinomycetota bacterium]|nr:PH domain-containing protein [Actinomycetota bacterium]